MEQDRAKNKKRLWAAITGFVIAVLAVFTYLIFFQSARSGMETERFVVPINSDQSIASTLEEQDFIKTSIGFSIANLLRGVGTVESGGYKISKSMTAWQIAGVLAKEPYMKWVVIPEGLRKEEIAGLLTQTLGWSDEEKNKWINTYTVMDFDHTEGVYFPDTYLIPVDEAPLDVAKRLRAKFEEKFAPYAKETVTENIKWTTLLKVASIVQREANGKEDMPLVSGIIWNRLLKNMKLEVDATLQYARGDTKDGWWAPITIAEKQIDSPYNTYKNTGLPPHPISNPGLSAIEAALHPTKTTCLYYLHDSSGEIHCSENYEGHKDNIEKYLK
ncbi:MAG: hypothetical protein A2431_00390 [Candidatus Zambryskibacteria bacterium RIFOXYC1_FULL_39_10]|uniref:Endolytic murein transglycosylase n=1 Tax=Candidatus Zambryskibacteria bacterium RIFOXYC1_FULL_39_10 TaxID=1802779 RepID=A0A1G2UZI3_9BACT|nr:MAG: hypothetical protein A2431_00390 [Candidatus Zambryskibacteria bacterium RIFOXYC1_FULL_39_10]OHB16005.1 MAG: hypothetical protein A2605_03930 [Candidatus Zambryskibacteria bacterium RIFOXYD1_FULL_39_35]